MGDFTVCVHTSNLIWSTFLTSEQLLRCTKVQKSPNNIHSGWKVDYHKAAQTRIWSESEDKASEVILSDKHEAITGKQFNFKESLS